MVFYTLEDLPKLEKLMAEYFPLQFKKCAGYLRHKNLFIHPHVLLKNGIQVFMVCKIFCWNMNLTMIIQKEFADNVNHTKNMVLFYS